MDRFYLHSPFAIIHPATGLSILPTAEAQLSAGADRQAAKREIISQYIYVLSLTST